MDLGLCRSRLHRDMIGLGESEVCFYDLRAFGKRLFHTALPHLLAVADIGTRLGIDIPGGKLIISQVLVQDGSAARERLRGRGDDGKGQILHFGKRSRLRRSPLVISYYDDHGFPVIPYFFLSQRRPVLKGRAA
ncbi:hypothetical protein SDC9_53982 [bioreactor metagenome]|uniref:Uncharacterized protein n=1 Tax=bioreactor metagenome TaxID=1076179 RepID=A0A644WUT4_9ZZZZ